MPITNGVHYVKFLRGSTTAWNNLLETPDAIDNDTLYFIYDSANTPTEGKLYLGQKLISSVGHNIGDININDLGDIYIDEQTLSDKQILTYNERTYQWENISLSAIINTAVHEFVGASSREDGMSGLVPAPKSGDQNKFLRGDKTWATIEIPSFDPNAFQVVGTNHVVSIAGLEQAPVGSIPIKTEAGIEWSSLSAGSITREVINEEDLEALIEQGATSDMVIYMVKKETDSVDNSYDEYMVIDGKKELIGSIGNVDLLNYVKKSVFDTHVTDINYILNDTVENGITHVGLLSRFNILEVGVGDLNNLLLSEGNTTLVEEINTINSRLQWHEIVQQL